MEYFSSFSNRPWISPVNGVRIKEVHLDNLMLTWMEFDPFSILPEHSHPHEQISMIVEGSMELAVDGVTRLMKKGDVAVVPPNTPHGGRTFEDSTIAVDAWHPKRDDYIP